MSNDAPLQGLDVEPFRIRKFEVGDLVFAKVKGYPAWPSKISQIETIIAGGKEKTRYNVFFYGTHQSSILRSSALYHYDTNSQTIMQKYGHKPKFQLAVAELERDMMAKISYLKEIRNKPDSGWLPGFNNACDGLLTDIQRDVFLGFDESESRVGSSLSEETMHQTSEVNSNTDEESEKEVGEDHSLYNKENNFEIMYMENIALPDTNEKFLIVSLSFDRERIMEEAKRLEEQLYMESCYVRIEPLPPHIEAQIQERKNYVETSPVRRGRPPKFPYKWHNSYKEAIKRRLRSTQRSKHVKLRRTSRLRDEERLKSLRTHKPSSMIETSNTEDEDGDDEDEDEDEHEDEEEKKEREKRVQATNLPSPASKTRSLNRVESAQKITPRVQATNVPVPVSKKRSLNQVESAQKITPSALSKTKQAPSCTEPVEKKSTYSYQSKILHQSKTGKMKRSPPSSKPNRKNGTTVRSNQHSDEGTDRPMTVWDKINAESGVMNKGSTCPSSDGVLLSCPMCRLKFCSSLELSVHVNAKHIGGYDVENSNNEARVSHTSDQAETPVTPFIMKQVPDELFEDPVKTNPSNKLSSDELFDNLINSSSARKPSNSSSKIGKENGSSDIFSCRRALPFP